MMTPEVLVILAWLASTVVVAQGPAAADPRLSDPKFVRIRDEAVASASCANRVNPVRTSGSEPGYPESLMREQIEGRAIVEGIVMIDGRVRYTRVVRADHPEFGRASIEALTHFRYKPATCSGRAVPAVLTTVHTFSVRKP